MDLTVINDQGQQVTSVAASDETFGRDYNEALVHQVVTAFQANARIISTSDEMLQELVNLKR